MRRGTATGRSRTAAIRETSVAAERRSRVVDRPPVEPEAALREESRRQLPPSQHLRRSHRTRSDPSNGSTVAHNEPQVKAFRRDRPRRARNLFAVPTDAKQQAHGRHERLKRRRHDVAFYAPWLTPRLATARTTGRTRPGLGGG